MAAQVWEQMVNEWGMDSRDDDCGGLLDWIILDIPEEVDATATCPSVGVLVPNA